MKISEVRRFETRRSRGLRNKPILSSISCNTESLYKSVKPKMLCLENLSSRAASRASLDAGSVQSNTTAMMWRNLQVSAKEMSKLELSISVMKRKIEQLRTLNRRNARYQWAIGRRASEKDSVQPPDITSDSIKQYFHGVGRKPVLEKNNALKREVRLYEKYQNVLYGAETLRAKIKHMKVAFEAHENAERKKETKHFKNVTSPSARMRGKVKESGKKASKKPRKNVVYVNGPIRDSDARVAAIYGIKLCPRGSRKKSKKMSAEVPKKNTTENSANNETEVTKEQMKDSHECLSSTDKNLSQRNLFRNEEYCPKRNASDSLVTLNDTEMRSARQLNQMDSINRKVFSETLVSASGYRKHSRMCPYRQEVQQDSEHLQEFQTKKNGNTNAGESLNKHRTKKVRKKLGKNKTLFKNIKMKGKWNHQQEFPRNGTYEGEGKAIIEESEYAYLMSYLGRSISPSLKSMLSQHRAECPMSSGQFNEEVIHEKEAAPNRRRKCPIHSHGSPDPPLATRQRETCKCPPDCRCKVRQASQTSNGSNGHPSAPIESEGVGNSGNTYKNISECVSRYKERRRNRSKTPKGAHEQQTRNDQSGAAYTVNYSPKNSNDTTCAKHGTTSASNLPVNEMLPSPAAATISDRNASTCKNRLGQSLRKRYGEKGQLLLPNKHNISNVKQSKSIGTEILNLAKEQISDTSYSTNNSQPIEDNTVTISSYGASKKHSTSKSISLQTSPTSYQTNDYRKLEGNSFPSHQGKTKTDDQIRIRANVIPLESYNPNICDKQQQQRNGKEELCHRWLQGVQPYKAPVMDEQSNMTVEKLTRKKNQQNRRISSHSVSPRRLCPQMTRELNLNRDACDTEATDKKKPLERPEEEVKAKSKEEQKITKKPVQKSEKNMGKPCTDRAYSSKQVICLKSGTQVKISPKAPPCQRTEKRGVLQIPQPKQRPKKSEICHSPINKEVGSQSQTCHSEESRKFQISKSAHTCKLICNHDCSVCKTRVSNLAIPKGLEQPKPPSRSKSHEPSSRGTHNASSSNPNVHNGNGNRKASRMFSEESLRNLSQSSKSDLSERSTINPECIHHGEFSEGIEVNDTWYGRLNLQMPKISTNISAHERPVSRQRATVRCN